MPTLFSPISATVGGVLIGLAAALLYAGIGRTAGISNILNSAFEDRADRGWRVLFIVGLMMGAAAWIWSTSTKGAPGTALSWPWLVVAGLLVGAGSRLGNGCTSGHGICGLAQFSKRSFVAVAVFMACAMLTVYAVRHLMGGL